MRTYEEIKTIVQTGLGMEACDLKLSNVKLANVFSNEVYQTNIYIKDKRIVSIDPDVELEAVDTIDCSGKFAIPGLIDTHIHFESTLLSPEALSGVMVPKGTTTICVDLMEIANVAGKEGIKALLNSMHRLPYRMMIEVSSRVPTAPGLETSGAILNSEEVDEIMAWQESVSLGELDPSKILFVKDEYLKKIANTLQKRKIVNGHAIGRLGQELNVYASAGVSDDHECVDYTELIARLRLGMKVMVREGSSERNVDELMKAVVEHNLDYDNLIFCTDDKHASEIREEGHINYNVNRSIKLGVPPMKALQMATINAAKHFRVEDEIGSITPGRLADILLVDSLEDIQPELVIFEGKAVAENGVLCEPCPVGEYPEWIKETVKFKNPITEHSFALSSKSDNAKSRVNVIQLIDDQIINEWVQADVPVENSLLSSDVGQDILKLAVVERYGKNGNVGVGFVKGFGLKNGALAYSMSHDHHNIVCVGTNDADMAKAVNVIHELQGGLSVVADNEVLSKMHLPIGGLMSDKPADEVLVEIEGMNQAARSLGCELNAPFMSLSFISLPTVPNLGLTDFGLIDVLNHELVSVEV